MKKCVYNFREGDKEVIANYVADREKETDAQLIDNYNKAYKLGFVGVHAQVRSILGLSVAFDRRFGRSPIKVTDNEVLEFTSPIVQVEGGWEYAVSKSG